MRQLKTPSLPVLRFFRGTDFISIARFVKQVKHSSTHVSSSRTCQVNIPPRLPLILTNNGHINTEALWSLPRPNDEELGHARCTKTRLSAEVCCCGAFLGTHAFALRHVLDPVTSEAGWVDPRVTSRPTYRRARAAVYSIVV